MTFSSDALRRELLPTTQLEELFFDMIVRLSTCAMHLSRHIDADPAFENPETMRRMRLLLSTESKLRYAYEEFRRLKVARQVQNEDADLAARPTLTVVATHTTRNGLRTQPKLKPSAPDALLQQLQQWKREDAAAAAEIDAIFAELPLPRTKSAA